MSRLGAAALQAWTALVYVYLLAPILVVALLALNTREIGLPIAGLTLRWLAEVLQDDAVLAAIRTSLWLGAVTAAISTVIGIAAAYALVRYRIRGSEMLVLALYLPMLVPHLILGVGLLLAFRLLGLPKNYLLLIVGHVTLTVPVVILMTQHRLAAIPQAVEEAARSLGAGAFETFRVVTLPLALPAFVVALVFAFMTSLDEVTATLFWRPANVETVTTQILAMLQYTVDQRVNALATLLTGFSLGLPALAAALSAVLAALQRRRTVAAP